MGHCPYVCSQRAPNARGKPTSFGGAASSSSSSRRWKILTLWEITGDNNSYLVKRKQSGGVQFSRDPLNLVNKNSRKVRNENHRPLRGRQLDRGRGCDCVDMEKQGTEMLTFDLSRTARRFRQREGRWHLRRR